MKKYILLVSVLLTLTLPSFADINKEVDNAIDKIEMQRTLNTVGHPYGQKELDRLAKQSPFFIADKLSKEWALFTAILELKVEETPFYDHEEIAKIDFKSEVEGMFGHFDDVYAFLRTAKKEPLTEGFNYSFLLKGGKRAVLLGEFHNQGTQKLLPEIILHLHKNDNLKAFGLEGLVENNNADLINIKKSGRNSRKAPISRLLSSKSVTILPQIKGVNVVSLDSVRLYMSGMDLKKNVKLPLPVMQALMDFLLDGFFKDIAKPLVHTGRNVTWLEKLTPYLEEENAIIAMHGGLLHTNYTKSGHSIGDYLKKAGYKPVVINYINALRFAADGDEYRQGSFIITVPKDKVEELGADYYIVFN